MEIDEKTRRQRRNTIIWIVVLAVLVLALAGLLIWQLKRLNEAKLKANATPTATATVTQTATKTVTQTATLTATSTQDFTSQARSAAEGFLAAYVSRNLAEAQPYMTNAFYSTWTQENFAGVSSPGRLNYQIINVAKSGDLWQVDAKVNLQLSGEDAGYESWQLDIIPQDGKYLVNAINAISL